MLDLINPEYNRRLVLNGQQLKSNFFHALVICLVVWKEKEDLVNFLFGELSVTVVVGWTWAGYCAVHHLLAEMEAD